MKMDAFGSILFWEEYSPSALDNPSPLVEKPLNILHVREDSHTRHKLKRIVCEIE
jgi:hypothetical protein